MVFRCRFVAKSLAKSLAPIGLYFSTALLAAVTASAQSLSGATINLTARPLPGGAQVTTLSGNPLGVVARDFGMATPTPSPSLSMNLPSGRTPVLAWGRVGESSRGVLNTWYQLREWNSLNAGAVCGTERFQTAIRARAREAKLATDAMPAGLKTILVFWELTPLWDDPRDYVRNSAGQVQGWIDEQGVFRPYLSPWWDAATIESRCRIESFFQEFNRIGGVVDYVVLDTERVMSNWQLDNFARERYGADSRRVSREIAEARRINYFRAIEADPRMDQLDRADLGFKTNGSLRSRLTQGSLSAHVAKWWYPEVKTGPNRLAYLQWNKLMLDRATVYLNYAVTEPIRLIYPRIKITNYDNQFTSAAHNLPDLGGHQVSLFPPEAITGNVQSRPMYGVSRDLTYYYVKSPFLAYAGTPFNALRENLNWLRSGLLTRPDVPFAAWLAPKSWGGDSGNLPARIANNPMYEEMVYHILLSTTEPMLFWNAEGISTPADEAALIAAISEYDTVMGFAKRRTPRNSPLIDWQTDFILSAADTETTTIYRFTPSLPTGQRPESLVRSVSPAALVSPSGKAISFGIGSTVRTTPGSAGLWITVPRAAIPAPVATKPDGSASVTLKAASIKEVALN